MKKIVRLLLALTSFVLGTLNFGNGGPLMAQAVPSLPLLSQTFNITTGKQLRFVLRDDPAFLHASVEIQIHRRIASRRSFQSIALGEVQSGVLDTVTLSGLQIQHTTNNTVLIQVPIAEKIDSTKLLSVPFDGVYPISIRLRDVATSKPTAEVLTFINVRRQLETMPDVQASTLVRLKAAPSLQPNGDVVISDETRARVTRFIAFLTKHESPLTVSVQPEIIASLAVSNLASDKELLVSLREQLRLRSITTAAYVPTDPSMFVAMNMREEFINQLRVGEDTLNKWLPGVAIQRGTYIADHLLTSDGLQLLRTAGVVSIILMPRAQQGITVSRTANVVLRPNGITSSNISIVASDVNVATSVSNNGEESSPAIAAYRSAAELLVARDDLLAGGHSPTSIRLMLSTTSGDLNSDSALSIATSTLDNAPGISMVDMAEPQIVSSDTAAIKFANKTPNTGAARVAGIVVARKELDATTSMVDEADIRREIWSHLFALGVSNTVVNGDTYIAGVRDLLSTVRGAVTVTTPGTITLSGRNGAIRIQIRNNSDVPLTVRVRMASAKLTLQNPVRLVDLAAGSTTEVKVEAGTRANGRFPLSIRVTTPEGNLEVAPYIRVTARMNAIAGFGQYVSLTLLILVLLWWGTHWRRTRHEGTAGTTVSD